MPCTLFAQGKVPDFLGRGALIKSLPSLVIIFYTGGLILDMRTFKRQRRLRSLRTGTPASSWHAEGN